MNVAMSRPPPGFFQHLQHVLVPVAGSAAAVAWWLVVVVDM
jgi:hypothetical protein